jgi:hypothetical protein
VYRGFFLSGRHWEPDVGHHLLRVPSRGWRKYLASIPGPALMCSAQARQPSMITLMSRAR